MRLTGLGMGELEVLEKKESLYFDTCSLCKKRKWAFTYNHNWYECLDCTNHEIKNVSFIKKYR